MYIFPPTNALVEQPTVCIIHFISFCFLSRLQFDFATSAACISSISAKSFSCLTRLHLLASNLRDFLFLLFLLYPDRVTNLMEKQNASSCQTMNKAASSVCARAEEQGRGNVTLREGMDEKRRWPLGLTWNRQSGSGRLGVHMHFHVGFTVNFWARWQRYRRASAL